MGRAKTGPCAPDVALDYPCSLSVLLLTFKSKLNPHLLRHWHLKPCGSTAGGVMNSGTVSPDVVEGGLPVDRAGWYLV